MVTERTLDWPGQSGKKYRYSIYRIGTKFESSPGNYVFACEAKPKGFKPIYIGQTSDISERFDNHHKMLCILQHKATHICVHTSSKRESTRRKEETDLINQWNPICNG